MKIAISNYAAHQNEKIVALAMPLFIAAIMTFHYLTISAQF
jgi:hypothetical protein